MVRDYDSDRVASKGLFLLMWPGGYEIFGCWFGTVLFRAFIVRGVVSILKMTRRDVNVH